MTHKTFNEIVMYTASLSVVTSLVVKFNVLPSGSIPVVTAQTGMLVAAMIIVTSAMISVINATP